MPSIPRLSLPVAPSLAAAADAAKECITDSGSGFGEADVKANFTVNLATNCDRKIACRVDAMSPTPAAPPPATPR